MKLKNYVLNNKVWLNNKYIKTKQNPKLEATFFDLFLVLQPVEKQSYKFKPPKNWRIHTIRTEQIDKTAF